MPPKPESRFPILVSLVVFCAGGLCGCVLFPSAPPDYPVVVLDSGVIVHDLLIPDEGPLARSGDPIELCYVLRLVDGTYIDSSADTGQTLRVVLGDGQLPAGIEEGVIGMRLFGQREIVVPPELAYGEEGVPPRIPPNATIRVEVELMSLGEKALDAPEADADAGS